MVSNKRGKPHLFEQGKENKPSKAGSTLYFDQLRIRHYSGAASRPGPRLSRNHMSDLDSA